MVLVASVFSFTAIARTAAAGSSGTEGRKSAGDLKIAVAPFQGKGNAACTRALTELAREVGRVEPWRSASRGPMPRSWADLSVWLGTKGNEIGADVLILGLASGQRIILQAYDPQKVKLIGLKRLTSSKRCKLGASNRAEITQWLKRVLQQSLEPESAPLVERDSDRDTNRDTDRDAKLEAEGTASARELAPREEPLTAGGRDPGLEDAGRADDPDRAARQERARRKASAAEGLEAEVEPIAPPRRATPIVAIEAELSLVNRSFGYSQPRTTNLRTLDVAGMPAPGIRIQAHPFAGASASGLPLFFEAFYRRAVGVKSARTDGGPDQDTRFEEGAALVGYRWVGTRLGLAVSPHAGYRLTQFSLHAPRNGPKEDQLPNVSYSSLDLGVSAELPIKSWITAVVSGSYLVVLSAGEVFSRAYFGSGSALAFDFQAGLRFSLTPSVSIGALGAYQSYSLSLDTDPGALRGADSASDALLSFRSTVRFEL